MSLRTRKNVGIIGLGIIGSRVRDVLRRKGYHVFVWNRTPRPTPNFVGAPAELAEMCDCLEIFVSDDEALDYVVRQLSPGLGARHLVIAHCTVAPQSMVAAAEIVERRGARFVEAPFTGSKEAAEKGELVFYVGGEEGAIKEARPILEATSRQILEIGPIGHATVIKLATNMVTAATVQVAAEALALVQAAGVPLQKFITAMEGNASNSATLKMKLPKMMQREFDPHFSVKHMLKDVQIASRLGLANHLELGVATAARDRLLEQVENGHGNEDYAALIRKYFPDVAVPTVNQSDLELFGSAAADSPVFSTAETVAPEGADAGVLPAAIEPQNGSEVSTAQMPAQIFSAPIPAPTPEEAAIGDASFPETVASGEYATDETRDEPAEQRGFLSRLLRR